MSRSIVSTKLMLDRVGGNQGKRGDNADAQLKADLSAWTCKTSARMWGHSRGRHLWGTEGRPAVLIRSATSERVQKFREADEERAGRGAFDRVRRSFAARRRAVSAKVRGATSQQRAPDKSSLNTWTDAGGDTGSVTA